MAKETRLDKLLSQKTFDVNDLKKLYTEYTKIDKYWKKYNHPVFIKFVIENHLPQCSDFMTELKLKKYKINIEKYFSNLNDRCYNRDFILELAEYHNIKLDFKVYNILIQEHYYASKH